MRLTIFVDSELGNEKGVLVFGPRWFNRSLIRSSTLDNELSLEPSNERGDLVFRPQSGFVLGVVWISNFFFTSDASLWISALKFGRCLNITMQKEQKLRWWSDITKQKQDRWTSSDYDRKDWTCRYIVIVAKPSQRIWYSGVSMCRDIAIGAEHEKLNVSWLIQQGGRVAQGRKSKLPSGRCL